MIWNSIDNNITAAPNCRLYNDILLLGLPFIADYLAVKTTAWTSCIAVFVRQGLNVTISDFAQPALCSYLFCS